MKALDNFKLIAVSTLLVIGLGACNKPGTPTTGDSAQNAGKTLDRKADQAAVAMDDTSITTQVKAAIFAEPGLKSLGISVETVNGVVTLTGTVDSVVNSDRAKTVASGVAGVKNVENRLMVKTP